MKIAIKCVKKGKCFPSSLGLLLLSILARELTKGCTSGGGSKWRQSSAFSEDRGRAGMGRGRTAAQSSSLFAAPSLSLADFRGCTQVLPSGSPLLFPTRNRAKEEA